MEGYCIYGDVMAVREGRATEQNLRRLAANIGDVIALRRVLGYDPQEDFYPDSATQTPGTMDTISSFLASYGKGKGEAPVSAAVAAVAEMEDLSRLSVGELIKRGDYEVAYKRIMEQSLKNPEKSIYFADQLRFLRKLMLVTEIK